MKKFIAVLFVSVSVLLTLSGASALTMNTDGLTCELPDSFVSMGVIEGMDAYLDLSHSLVLGVLSLDGGTFSMDSIAELVAGKAGQTGILETRHTDSNTPYTYLEATDNESGALFICAIFIGEGKDYIMAMHSLNELQPSDKALFSSILDTANLTASVAETDVVSDRTVHVHGIRTPNPASTIAPTPEPAPQTVYAALQKGDKGDEVKQLQQRLIELNYLDGGADGDFGNKTKAAVELFQSSAKLPVTGIADQETQQALYADNAPKAKVYKSLNFKELSRNPNQHIGEYYTFSGQVIQALESSNWNGTTSVTLRIATKSWYDDVVMVTYTRQGNDSRILEDDKVTVKGEYKGIESYTAVMGNMVTVPLFDGELVALR